MSRRGKILQGEREREGVFATTLPHVGGLAALALSEGHVRERRVLGGRKVRGGGEKGNRDDYPDILSGKGTATRSRSLKGKT